MRDITYAEALEKVAHLIALGDTTVYLRDGQEMPWNIAETVEVGGSYRMNVPVSAWITGRHKGLTFRWSVDFETREANGSGTSQFARARLRDVMVKLPPAARIAFAEVLRNHVLPGLAKTTEEIRGALARQWDSEDAVRGLIVFAYDDRAIAATRPTQDEGELSA